MNEKKRPRVKRLSDDTKIKYAIDLIEELSWLLDSKRNFKFNEIPSLLRRKLLPTDGIDGAAEPYISPNPNIHYLIGVLPRLFQDTKLFSRNEEIAEFASEVLNIEISRVEKRSKYELIGLIVCEANDLDEKELNVLVEALSAVTNSAEKITKMAEEKSSTGFSWNETIQKLAR